MVHANDSYQPEHEKIAMGGPRAKSAFVEHTFWTRERRAEGNNKVHALHGSKEKPVIPMDTLSTSSLVREAHSVRKTRSS